MKNIAALLEWYALFTRTKKAEGKDLPLDLRLREINPWKTGAGFASLLLCQKFVRLTFVTMVQASTSSLPYFKHPYHYP